MQFRISSTHKATDWDIYLLISVETIEQAVFIESRIKKMKSRKYIENLRKYPEIVDRILSEFNML
jgi:putative endonuclease